MNSRTAPVSPGLSLLFMIEFSYAQINPAVYHPQPVEQPLFSLYNANRRFIHCRTGCFTLGDNRRSVCNANPRSNQNLHPGPTCDTFSDPFARSNRDSAPAAAICQPGD